MLKGLRDNGQPGPLQRASYRNPWIQPEGGTPAFFHESKIIDINLSTWTVDVRTQWDRKNFLDIQVSSTYMNPTTGEGIYVFPEVGSKCFVMIPSDGPPPVVMGFIMPAQTIGDVGTDDAPAGTNPSPGASTPTGSSYGGGRPRAKPGDIYMKGRDGNFVVLHRGGVLQIGSTALSQRLFIPLNNVLTDISQNYHHYNTGGAINWAVSTGPNIDNPPTCLKHTFRLHANEAQATVMVRCGTIADILGVDPSATGASDIQSEGIGTDADNPIIMELLIAPEEINADDGTVRPTTRGAAKLQFAFDRAGGGYLWAAGSLVIATKKRVVLRADGNITMSTGASLAVSAANSARIDGGSLLELQGQVVKIGPGDKKVAHVGSPVVISIPPGSLVAKIPAPVGAMVPVSAISDPTGLLPITLLGAVSDGEATVLV
jgi:hypothetical protein